MTHKELLDRAREIIAEWEDPTIFRPAIAMNDPDEVQLARAVLVHDYYHDACIVKEDHDWGVPQDERGNARP